VVATVPGSTSPVQFLSHRELSGEWANARVLDATVRNQYRLPPLAFITHDSEEGLFGIRTESWHRHGRTRVRPQVQDFSYPCWAVTRRCFCERHVQTRHDSTASSRRDKPRQVSAIHATTAHGQHAWTGVQTYPILLQLGLNYTLICQDR
jgi:hypothetical protein